MYSYKEFRDLYIGPNLHHDLQKRENSPREEVIHNLIQMTIPKFCPVAIKLEIYNFINIIEKSL